MRTVTRPLAVALAAALASGCGVAKYDDVQRPVEPAVVVPPPVISQTPEKLTKDRSATFAFAAADAAAPVTFRCKLDAGELSACTSSVRYEALGDGAHTFTVEAVDAAGGGHPATYGWTVDGTAPAVSITGQPDPVWASTAATFAFDATDASGKPTFRCSLDGGQPAECQSGASYGPLADGEHRFAVEATDPVGNATVVSARWTVDATGPTIDATGPASVSASLIASGSAAFTFSGTDASAPVKFWCSLDTGALEPCVSGRQYTVADGPHAFTLQAADALGNVSRWQRGWTVDTTPPVVTLSAKPDAVTKSTSAQFEFSATDVGGGVSFGCKLDGVSASCTSPRAYTVAEGTHTFTVTAFDAAGNSSEVSHTWMVDRTGPALAFTTVPRSGNSSKAKFEFAGSDASGSVIFTCSFGAAAAPEAPATPCTSPVSFTALDTGSYRFTVHGQDAVGNTSTLAHEWIVNFDVTVLTYCNDGFLQQFEGCDDGTVDPYNTPGDGCCNCRVELDNRTPIATVETNGAPWVAVTSSGMIYLRQSGVGGAPDSFLKVIPGDPVVVTTDAVPGVLGSSGGDVIAIGEDLVFASSAQDGKTFIQKWTASTNTTTTLFQFATGSSVQSFAMNTGLDRAFHAGPAGPIYKATGPSASTSFWPAGVSDLLYDRAGDRLYVVSDGALKVDATGGAGSTGSFSDLYWNPDLRDVAADAYGMIYGACYSVDPATSARVPCSPGAVVALKLDPSTEAVTVAPIVDSSRAIDRVVYEPASGFLYLSTSAQVPGSATTRTSVYRMPVAVP